jgi:hypothetical protein
MKLTFVYANNPKWANRSQTLIDLTVRFEGFDSDLPFGANPNDPEQHGRDIYARALAGEFGPIAPFDPTPYTTEDVAATIKEKRNELLQESDWTQLPDVPQATKDAWSTYRQALRDIPQQAGFPWYDTVVVEVDKGFFINTDNVPWPAAPN